MYRESLVEQSLQQKCRVTRANARATTIDELLAEAVPSVR